MKPIIFENLKPLDKIAYLYIQKIYPNHEMRMGGFADNYLEVKEDNNFDFATSFLNMYVSEDSHITDLEFLCVQNNLNFTFSFQGNIPNFREYYLNEMYTKLASLIAENPSEFKF